MKGKRCHKQNGSPNRNDLSSFLKVVNDVDVERRAGGKLFHDPGPATANTRSPMDARRVDGTTRSEIDAERSRRRAALATDTVRLDKYPGTAPFRQSCTSTHDLYWMRCGTGSQCKSIRSCVTWSYLWASAMRRAAALTTDCTRSSSYCGRPARATLQ